MPRRQVSPDELRHALAGFPTGVAVVTALADGEPAGATVNAVTSLSLEPPLMLAALDRGSRTLRAVERAGRFGINGLAGDQEELAHGFASKDPVAEKWIDVGWSESEDLPRLEGCALWVACQLESVIPAGDHVIVTGVVEAVEGGGSTPLIFFWGEYRGL